MKTKVKLRTLVGIAIVTLSAFLLPVLAVWKKSLVMDRAKENEFLKVATANLRNAYRVDQFELNRLRSRERIEAIARTEMQLEYPKAEDIVVLELRRPPQKESRLAGFLPSLVTENK